MDTKSGEHFVSLAEVLQGFNYNRRLQPADIILRISDDGEVHAERMLLWTTANTAVTARVEQSWGSLYEDPFTWSLVDRGSFAFGKLTGVKVTSMLLERRLIGKMRIIIEAETLPMSYLGWMS